MRLRFMMIACAVCLASLLELIAARRRQQRLSSGATPTHRGTHHCQPSDRPRRALRATFASVACSTVRHQFFQSALPRSPQAQVNLQETQLVRAAQATVAEEAGVQAGQVLHLAAPSQAAIAPHSHEIDQPHRRVGQGPVIVGLGRTFLPVPRLAHDQHVRRLEIAVRQAALVQVAHQPRHAPRSSRTAA